MGLPDEERFLSAQADRLGGASRKEKLRLAPFGMTVGVGGYNGVGAMYRVPTTAPGRAGLRAVLHFVGGEARRTLNPSRFSGLERSASDTGASSLASATRARRK